VTVGTGVGVAVEAGAGVGVGLLVVVQPATTNATAITVIASANVISLDIFMKMTPSIPLIYMDLAVGARFCHVHLRLLFPCRVARPFISNLETG
jgi:hypothetical protein